MTELVEMYSKGVKKRFKNYWPAWPAFTRYQLGDIGTLNGHVFQKVATLTELGLNSIPHTGVDTSQLDISSEKDVSITFKAAGQANPLFTSIGNAEAGMRIDFGQSGAFIVEAPQIVEDELTGLLSLQKAIVHAYTQGKWDRDWLVITRLVRAASATVLISRSSQASLELAASGQLSAVVTALGDVNAGITLRRQSGDTMNMICAVNATPLFQLSRIKTSFFGTPKFSIHSMRPADSSLANLTPGGMGGNSKLRESVFFDVLTDDELVEE